MIYTKVFTTVACLSIALMLPACAKTSKTRVATNDKLPGNEQVESQDLAAGKNHPGNQERMEAPVASTAGTVCTPRRDARGRVTYDNPACANKYGRQYTEVAAACESFVEVDQTRLVADQNRLAADQNRPSTDQSRLAADQNRLSTDQDRLTADPNRLSDDPNYSERARTSSTVESVPDTAHRGTTSASTAHRGTTSASNVHSALNDVLKAEAAGNEGNIPEMLRRTRMSLDTVTELQGAGSGPYLTGAANDLRQTMIEGCRNQIASAALSDARRKLWHSAYAGGTAAPLTTGSRLPTQTVKGELVRNTSATGTMGGESFAVRDRQNREIPIRLSPEMSNKVQPGDMVEAQIDSKGEVVAISKAQ